MLYAYSNLSFIWMWKFVSANTRVGKYPVNLSNNGTPLLMSLIRYACEISFSLIKRSPSSMLKSNFAPNFTPSVVFPRKNDLDILKTASLL